MKVIDPLAQSFYVENESGAFVTSVDLYFLTVDLDLPVTIQLRPMELGLPTQTVYPFSEVVLDPKDIQVSEDASIPTRVTFDSPVYLLGQRFHALVYHPSNIIGEVDPISLSEDPNWNKIRLEEILRGLDEV